MNSSSEEFVKLREEILERAIPLLDSDTIPSEDRFKLSLQLAQAKGSVDSYTKAFRIADTIEGDDRLRAYLDLIGDLDYVIQEKLDMEGPVSVTVPAPREESPQTSNADIQQ